MVRDDLDRQLIDGWQRDFPLCEAPFSAIGERLGISGEDVIARVQRLIVQGGLTRVGAVVSPNTIGASTLAAVAAPSHDVERVAAIIGEEAGVNHNYEREHAYNLWFVVTGATMHAVRDALRCIEQRTGLPVLDLPMEKAFHIDLGFPLYSAAGDAARVPSADAAYVPDKRDLAILQSIEQGLPLVARPYDAIGLALGITGQAVCARLAHLCSAGIVKRFGLVVRHRAFGFDHNAMVVWDIPDAQRDAVGAALAAAPFVTLCYARPRRLPEWRYNLFTMIHGSDRATVERQIAQLAQTAAPNIVHDVLFSRRCFRQRGARLSAA